MEPNESRDSELENKENRYNDEMIKGSDPREISKNTSSTIHRKWKTVPGSTSQGNLPTNYG